MTGKWQARMNGAACSEQTRGDRDTAESTRPSIRVRISRSIAAAGALTWPVYLQPQPKGRIPAPGRMGPPGQQQLPLSTGRRAGTTKVLQEQTNQFGPARALEVTLARRPRLVSC